ncbi:hypothetical protein FOPG_07090 [Fusarium oxysporum f. sp. conglutinans race 2 54008]|uniref:Uncharacterized protein n=4 Tax=Fusarium oxysporum TaxID=5507 RepID=A0A0J9V8R2_FUSO4|nr:hypothetical protein FOXG_19821 [Fusarium oxysporum f. sp. lycopersici 4287]EXA01483.1 hypothetical protein FOWG_01327 [Fusarium oxysporum f. sp. lycopersici MN25]EXK32172.1 hypothetical protein FOMG_12464 [Fusarium oxysporum f. sp. melonis 26406]EXL78876.1 hypothetical protein FOPG_07090 [Fusarium oxysporum f. sp. conglutinans race 2 54008]EXM29686.1 hypothetical protein FOTG_04829 [Fusarium oxysporum f. sp. vasinfectum 25433]KAI8409512.1 hypothetical protein FOFC_09352 [Fusarium oxysporum
MEFKKSGSNGQPSKGQGKIKPKPADSERSRRSQARGRVEGLMRTRARV